MESTIPKPVLFTLVTTVFLDFLGFTIVLPYLYFFSQGMGASVVLYGLLVASYAVMQVVCAPAFGMLSDRYGRRFILLFTLVGSSASYFLFGLSNVLWLLFLSRVFAGAFSSTYSIAQAYVADVTGKDSRLKYLSFLAGAYGLGYVLGPIIGGVLSTSLGYATPAFFAGFLAALNALIMYAKFPAPRQGLSPHLGAPWSLNPLRALGKGKELNILLVLNFICTLIFVFLLVIVPPWLQAVFRFGSLETGMILSYAAGVSIITVVAVVPRLAKRFSSSSLILIGLAVISFNYFGLSLVAHGSPMTLSLVVAMAGLLSLGFSLIGPALNSLISVTASSGQQGETMGRAKSMAGLAQVVAPAMATASLSFGTSVGMMGLGFLIAAVFTLSSLPLIFLLRRSNYLGTWEQLLQSRGPGTRPPAPRRFQNSHRA